VQYQFPQWAMRSNHIQERRVTQFIVIVFDVFQEEIGKIASDEDNYAIVLQSRRYLENGFVVIKDQVLR
jgi:hypothetical protein